MVKVRARKAGMGCGLSHLSLSLEIGVKNRRIVTRTLSGLGVLIKLDEGRT